MKKIFMIFALVWAGVSSAAVVQSTGTKIKEINSYSEVINSDTLIAVDTPHASCLGGYWLKVTDGGFEKNMSMLLSAFHTQSSVIIYAYDSETWPHSSLAYCQITQIRLIR